MRWAKEASGRCAGLKPQRYRFKPPPGAKKMNHTRENSSSEPGLPGLNP